MARRGVARQGEARLTSMTEDVGTTKRKPLTPTQRLKLFERHSGKCVLCGLHIRSGESWIDEHIRPLALGGTNDVENRRPVHVSCAAAKTSDDIKQIAKAKRQKRASLGIKKEGKKIQSRGFDRIEKHRGIDKSALPDLPRRGLYQ